MNLRSSERLSLAALSLLALLTLVGRPPQTLALLAGEVSMAGLILLLAWIGPRSTPAGVARDFWPAPMVVIVFSLLEPVIANVNPLRWDETFAAVDVRYFSRLVEGWHGFLGRPAPFTDLVYLLYFSYYVLPVLLGIVIRVTRGPSDFEDTTFALLLAFYLSYVGYFFFPTSGPRIPESQVGLLGGGPLSEAVRGFLRVAEGNHLDAFPSGHTAVSLVSLALGWRLLPRWRAWLALWVGGVIFATVYIHVHYVIDLVAGGGVAVGALLVDSIAARRLERGTAPGSLAAP